MWLLYDFFQWSKIFGKCKKFGILLVTSIPTNYLYPSKSSDNCLCKRRIFMQFYKIYFVIRIFFRNENFFTSPIFCVINNQQRNVRQYVIFILQRMGWVKRSRLSNLWGAACKVLTNVAIEHIWRRSSTLQFVFGTFPKIIQNKSQQTVIQFW